MDASAIHPHRPALPKITGFDWDAGNSDKCRQHGVPIAAIERLFQNPIGVFPDPIHSKQEERFRAIGRTDGGRYLFVAFTLRSVGYDLLIRPDKRPLHAPQRERPL
jgi:uncharacterized protein